MPDRPLADAPYYVDDPVTEPNALAPLVFEAPPVAVLWQEISDADGDFASVLVPSHDDEHRTRAAEVILGFIDPDWIGWQHHRAECVEVVAKLLTTEVFRQHGQAPWHEHEVGECGTEDEIDRAVADSTEAETLACKREEGGCGCEEEGWFCSEGDGPPWPFLSTRRQDIDEALEVVRLAHMEEADV